MVILIIVMKVKEKTDMGEKQERENQRNGDTKG